MLHHIIRADSTQLNYIAKLQQPTLHQGTFARHTKPNAQKLTLQKSLNTCASASSCNSIKQQNKILGNWTNLNSQAHHPMNFKDKIF
jgi:hypothetical protein